MTGHLCGLGCELPAGHEGDHDDLGGGTWPQAVLTEWWQAAHRADTCTVCGWNLCDPGVPGPMENGRHTARDPDPGDGETDCGGGWFFARNH
jgi:hypothetical protein